MTDARLWLVRLLVAAWTVGGVDARTRVRAQQPPNLPDTMRADTTVDLRTDISGVWEGTFRLDSAWRLPERADQRAVPAIVRFNPVGDASPTTSSPRSVHAGTFEIDFRHFGFTLATMEALGWSVNADSMHAILNPTVDNGRVEVHGAFRGEGVVAGTWSYGAGSGGARGTFELKRARNR